jgi:uncharacterized protein YlzI (FlbEa/FlbD family)
LTANKAAKYHSILVVARLGFFFVFRVKGNHLILLTKLDDSPILVNLETIKYCEATPDTRLVFINGDSLIVRETLEVIEEKVITLKAKILNQSS